MKKLGIVLAVAPLLALAQASMAVDLQAGWFAQIGSISVYAYDSNNRPYLFGGGWFFGSLGTCGPFLVTDEPGHDPHLYRTVRVPANVCSVATGTSVEMPIGAMPSRVAYVSIDYHTNYDATKMRLEFARRDPSTGLLTVLWSQNASGDAWHSRDIAYQPQPDGLLFRVVAVPEPSGLAGMMLPLSLLLGKRIGKTRR